MYGPGRKAADHVRLHGLTENFGYDLINGDPYWFLNNSMSSCAYWEETRRPLRCQDSSGYTNNYTNKLQKAQNVPMRL